MPLHFACKLGNQEMVLFLIENQCDLNIKTMDGQNGAYFAISEGNLECLQLLGESFANLNEKIKGTNIVQLATQFQQFECVEYLFQVSFTALNICFK